MQYDVIIIGAGISALACAKYLDKKLKVLLLCKDEPWDCNTFFAQGGIAFPKDKQDVALHIKDTLNAGANHNNPEALKILTQESFGILEDLLQGGFKVDKDTNDNILYAKEGGHSIARILHSGGDGTGREIHTFLISHLNHTLHKGAQVIDLLIEENQCYGVSVQTKNQRCIFYANHIVIASGGVGGLFAYHTNAHTISGDLHAMALENGLKLQDMEMLQFHPTAFVDSARARKTLITEALRGEGAKIINENNERFLFDYDKRGELAPRDIVARAIFDQKFIKKHQVFLDASNFTKKEFIARFPNVYRSLRFYKLDIPAQKIPIAPAFHYSMGGIKTNLDGVVCGMKNLYAIGECANSGIHGANRLASNSLLDGLVFGKIVAQTIQHTTISNPKRNFPIIQEILQKEGDEQLKNVLRRIMWEKVGIIRSQTSLLSALEGVEVMMQGNIGRMLKLRLMVAREIITQALQRKKSLGAHYLLES